MNQLEARLEDIKTPLNVAVIGCVVNGPGKPKRLIWDLPEGIRRVSLYLSMENQQHAYQGQTFWTSLRSKIRKQAEIKEHARAELIAHSTDSH